jgi:hypothetical protein
MLISLGGYAASGGNFTFLADSAAGQTNTQVTLGVRALDFDSIISFQGSLRYDTSKVHWVAIQGYGLPSMGTGNFGTNNAANGWVTFSWNESNLMPISVPDSTVLFELVFELVGNGGSLVPITFSSNPTLMEVVDHTFTPIGFSHRNGVIEILSVPTCPAPDSLRVGSIGVTQSTLNWKSSNVGANFLVEWGTQGYAPGNGLDSATGVSVSGQNSVVATGLSGGTAYDFYVHEDCGALASVNVGPISWITEHVIFPPGPVTLYGDSVVGLAGQLVTVHIRGIDFVDIVSLQGTLAWDTAVAHYDGSGPFGLPGMSAANIGNTQAANGILSFSWNDATLTGVTMQDSASLFAIQFRLTQNSGAVTPLELLSTPVPIEVTDVNFSVVPVTLVFGEIRISGTSTGIENPAPDWQLYPNPLATGATRFGIKGLSDGVEAILWNSLGKSHLVDCSNGYCVVNSPLEPGLWILEVRGLEGKRFQKLLVQ